MQRVLVKVVNAQFGVQCESPVRSGFGKASRASTYPREVSHRGDGVKA